MMDYEYPNRDEDIFLFLTRTIERLNENNNLLRDEIEKIKDELKAQKGD